jgi:hypothetical protein
MRIFGERFCSSRKKNLFECVGLWLSAGVCDVLPDFTVPRDGNKAPLSRVYDDRAGDDHQRPGEPAAREPKRD